MQKSSVFAIAALSALLVIAADGCKKNKGEETTDPEEPGEQEVAAASKKGLDESNEDSYVGVAAPATDPNATPAAGTEGAPAEGGQVAAKEDKLPPPAKPKQVCRGKGKKRECKMVDPQPKISAQRGVKTLMGQYRFGMTAEELLGELTKNVEKEYTERQKQGKNPVQQDENRRWRQAQLDELKKNHVQFTAASRHKWGVSLIQYEYADDSNEEMLWVKTTPQLRKFYFFRDGQLWKIFYAYDRETWANKNYEQIVEDHFKKWFGVSPELKVKQDPKTKAPMLRYYEWESKGGEKIRSFDMLAVNGVIGLAVVDGAAEQRIGERLPNIKPEEKMNESVAEVLGGSDVCYNADGNVVECSSKGK